MVVKTAVSRMKVASHGFTRLHKLTPADLHEILPVPHPNRVLGLLRGSNTTPALREIPKLRKQLEAIPNYHEHQVSVEGLFGALEERQGAGPDLLTNWKDCK